MKSTPIIYFAVISTLLSCVEKKQAATMSVNKDPHSYSQPEQVVAKHLELSLNVNFETKILAGKASWHIENITGADSVVFDTRDLTIEKITLDDSEQEVKYTLSNPDSVFGQRLAVAITPNVKHVNIYYKTSPNAAALQWLNPAQTAGKQEPFLFSQSQSILARTWLPCQDSPGIRFTYNAELTVPKKYLALMSAVNPQEKNASGVYAFKQEKPIPSYLMAIAVGDVTFKSIGARTGVYAEPATIEKAHYEFAQMEDMLVAAEKLYGAYAWGRYDVLVLPPSFPFGGMENPCLTFATPTILAGDRSLVSLVAHEMAHSWSGNLVTNATWNELWLNEGFTVYFERRIMEAIEGPAYTEMLTLIGKQDLDETMADFGHESTDTQLKLNLEGRNPDDAMTDIAYEKGFFLLKTIENAVGREKFDVFIKKYFADHAFQTSNTEDFLAYLKKELFNGNQAQYDSLKIDTWVYKPGLPATMYVIHSARFDAVDEMGAKFKNGEAPEKLNTAKWSSHEWLHFVRNLPSNITLQQMQALDKAFHYTETGNNEVLAAWLQLSIAKDYKVAYPRLEDFLTHVGRRKFLLPLYKELMKTDTGKEMAKKIYAKARLNYHAVAVETLDKIVK